jgi:hypothetical protein
MSAVAPAANPRASRRHREALDLESEILELSRRRLPEIVVVLHQHQADRVRRAPSAAGAMSARPMPGSSNVMASSRRRRAAAK